MGLIDWGRKPPNEGSSAEIAGLSGLVDAMWERRRKLAELEQQRQLEMARQAEAARHNQANEGYNDRTLGETTRYHDLTNTTQRNHNQATEEQARAKARMDLLKDYETNASITPDYVRAGEREFGGGQPQQQPMPPQGPPQPEPPPQAPPQAPPPMDLPMGTAPPTPQAPMPIEPPPLYGNTPYSAPPGPPPADRPLLMGDTTEADAAFMGIGQPPAHQAPQQAPQAMPPVSSKVFGYDLGARDQARRGRADETTAELTAHAQQVIADLPPGQRQFARNAAAFAINQAKLVSGSGKPEDAVERFNKAFDMYFQEAGQDRRAYIAAAAAKEAARTKSTDGEGKAAFFAASMLSELDEIGPLQRPSNESLKKFQSNQMKYQAGEKVGTGSLFGALTVSGLREAGVLPTYKYDGLSEEEQVYLNRIDSINESYLRFLSGAAIKDDEKMRSIQENALHANDTPAMADTKIKRMRRDGIRLMALSGNAAEKIYRLDGDSRGGQPQQQPAPAASSGDASIARAKALKSRRKPIP
jgi:hypothetical protein